jgi:hypothetical protein
MQGQRVWEKHMSAPSPPQGKKFASTMERYRLIEGRVYVCIADQDLESGRQLEAQLQR